MSIEILESIFGICCDEFGLEKNEVLSKSKKSELCYCRRAFVNIVKEKFDLDYAKIGNTINRKGNDIRYLYEKKINNKYYLLIFNKIRKKVKNIESD